MSIHYPTVADVKAAHQLEIEESGGSEGLRDADALEAAVLRPRQTFGGNDLYPDLPTKAAALFESLICNHPFVDGNKRTAVAVAETFLEANGARLGVTNTQLVQFAVGVGSGGYDTDTITEWFQANTVPFDE